MAVPEGQRGEGRFTVLVKANMLAIYTIKICNNKNVFLEQYQSALTNDIIRTAKDIFIYCWTANNILIRKTDEDKEEKKKVDECFEAWKAHAEKGNSKKLIRRMEEFYAALWKEDEHGRHEHGEKTENDQRTEKHGGHAGTDRKTAGDDRVRGRDGRR